MCVCTHAFKLLLTFSHQSSSDIIILPEIYQMEGFSNWIKIERMVSNYFLVVIWSNKNVTKEVWDKDIHTHAHTHAHTQTYKYTCVY